MGTRNLTMVLLDDKIVVAQYCQWDGYPEGQGATVVKFVENMNKEKFIEELRKLEYYKDRKEVWKIWKEHGASENGAGLETSDKMKRYYPELHRDIGASILQLIHFGEVKKLEMDLDFVNDSSFCEWAYLIDLDNDILEVYRGFNKEPLTKEDRFYTGEPPDGEYYPIKLEWKGSFDKVQEIFELEKCDLDDD